MKDHIMSKKVFYCLSAPGKAENPIFYAARDAKIAIKIKYYWNNEGYLNPVKVTKIKNSGLVVLN
jgi:hypothetical protein